MRKITLAALGLTVLLAGCAVPGASTEEAMETTTPAVEAPVAPAAVEAPVAAPVAPAAVEAPVAAPVAPAAK